MHPCPENWVVIGRAVAYYARGSHAFSAGNKCWHCTFKRVYAGSLKNISPLSYTFAVPYNTFHKQGRVSLICLIKIVNVKIVECVLHIFEAFLYTLTQ